MEKRLGEACSLSWFAAAQGRLPTIEPFDTIVNPWAWLDEKLVGDYVLVIPWSFEPAGLQPR
jgi:hypothetical protein